jgi:hypothetical protein
MLFLNHYYTCYGFFLLRLIVLICISIIISVVICIAIIISVVFCLFWFRLTEAMYMLKLNMYKPVIALCKYIKLSVI